jgi:SAM-dependent methyltransferase
MPDVTWTYEFFPVLLRPTVIPLEVSSVLDVGCGRGILGCLLKIYREPKRVVGLDVYKPYLDFVKGLGAYDETIQLDLAGSTLPFKEKEFDVVVCLEVIEHLKKDPGLKLLEELERVGKRVIISTPGVFFTQPHLDGNVNQEHLSYYPVTEFEDRGYKVYGVGDVPLFGKHIPLISGAFGKISFKFPKISRTILAIKDASG